MVVVEGVVCLLDLSVNIWDVVKLVVGDYICDFVGFKVFVCDFWKIVWVLFCFGLCLSGFVEFVLIK